MSTAAVSLQRSPDQEIPAVRTWRRMEKTAFPGMDSLVSDSPSHLPQPDFLPLASQSSTDADTAQSKMLSGIPNYTKRKKLLSGENHATCTPWRKKDYTCDTVGLDEEIKDFYDYIKPRPCEKRMRAEVIDRVKKIITSRWSQAQVYEFGSYCTDLFLPTSDIDLVVFGEWVRLPLFSLEEEFVKSDIAVEGSILVLDKTAVPIIKFIDKATEVKVDISFNQMGGIKSAQMILRFIQQYPLLPPLAMVIKQFLTQRQLNEVYYGGINSYSLLLMIVSFLQLHPRKQATDSNANLGVLLIEFFELYGRNFNYMKVGISVLNGGCYFPKEALSTNGVSEVGLLYIQDPLNDGENASRGCYGIQQVKQSFEHAFNRLHIAVLTREKPTPTKPSLLSNIVQISEEVDEYRNWVESQWSSAPLPLPPNMAPPFTTTIHPMISSTPFYVVPTHQISGSEYTINPDPTSRVSNILT